MKNTPLYSLKPENADLLLVKIPEKIMVTNIHITNTILYGRIDLMNNLSAYIRIDLRSLINETLDMSFLMDKDTKNVLKNIKSNHNTDIYDGDHGNYMIENNSFQTELKKITPVDFKELIPELNCMQPVTTIKCDQIAKVIGKNDSVCLGVCGGKIEFVELQKTSHIILALDDTTPLEKTADQKVKSHFFLKIKNHEMTVTLCRSKRDCQYWLKTTFQMTEQVEIECFEPVLEV